MLITGQRCIDRNLEELCQSANQIVDFEKSKEYKDEQQMASNYDSQITRCERQLLNQRSKKSVDHAAIDSLEEKLETLLQYKNKNCGLGKQYSITTSKIKGAKEFIAIVQEQKKNSTHGVEEAEFKIMNAIRIHAGCFNAQHGQKELTCARGIKSLEERDKIRDITCSAYASDSKKKEIVREIAEWWHMMAGMLFEIAKILKSQQPVVGTRLKTLEENIVKYGVAWRQRVTWKQTGAVFYKMHQLECPLINFIWEHGMAGIVSTEGFENKHFHLAKTKQMLAPMVNTKQRVQKISYRQQMFLIPGVEPANEQLEKLTAEAKRGPRGCYSTTLKSRALEDATSLPGGEDIVSDAPSGFFRTEKGILPVDFKEYYNFFQRNLAPDEWTKDFENQNSLGSRAKARMKYVRNTS